MTLHAIVMMALTHPLQVLSIAIVLYRAVQAAAGRLRSSDLRTPTAAGPTAAHVAT